jgi:hypothetical protein
VRFFCYSNPFENVSQLKYFGNGNNLIQEEIKRRLNLGNVCILSSHLLSKNIKNKIYKSIILSVVPYVCEILSLALRQEHILRVFENRVLRRMFGLKRDEVAGG